MLADTAPSSKQTLIALIDAALPQWQCGQCNTPGCLPYAEAIADGEAINLCIPGGEPMVKILAELTNRPIQPVALGPFPLQSDGRPQAIRAIIREDECIGCTKCIDACPVDAIMGTGKMMHTILTDLCTGCELCIPPCPVDCIDIITIEPLQTALDAHYELHREHQFKRDKIDLRQRFEAKQAREAAKQSIKLSASRFANEPTVIASVAPSANVPSINIEKHSSASSIQLSTLRSQIKKLEKQLSVMPNDAKKLADLEKFTAELAQLNTGNAP
jgi:electron transport complex protein RnfB